MREPLLLVPLELGIIAYVIVRIRRTTRGMRGAAATLDTPERIATALQGVLPVPIVGRLLATELALGWYALASWRRPPHAPPEARAFSYHRKNGLIALLSALVGMSMVELAVVHLLVHARNPRAAWILSAASAVAVVWLVGFVRALVLRPVLLYPDRIVVRGGILWSADIPLDHIESIEQARAANTPAKATPGYLRITPVAQPNVTIRLRDIVEAHGMYEMRRSVRVVSLNVDEPEELVEGVGDRIAQKAP